MPTREEMRSLAEEIVDSYADRVAGIAQIKQAEGERKQTEAREIAQRKSDVGTMFKEFDDSHATMSKELKADLAKVAPAIKQAEGERKQTEAREIAQRKSDVGTMLKEFHEEQAGVRDEWQILSAIMQEKRGGPIIKMEPPAEEMAEEAAEITPEIGDIRDRAFEYLANHPDGTRLVEMEQEFGLARIKIARVLRNLIDENKVEKRDMLYFAI